MKIINENPYRIAGVLSNATEREIQKQQSKIKKFAKIGRDAGSELDFGFLAPISRSERNVNKAFSDIEHNTDKVLNSLFWFVRLNSFDETALNYLVSGDKEKAIEIWSKVTNGKEITSKNFSCFNNIGTLKLLGDDKSEITDGIAFKLKLLDSSVFVDFVHSVADETCSINSNEQAEKLVDILLSELNGEFTLSHIVELFKSCNSDIKKYVYSKFTEKPIQNIEVLIENTKIRRKEDKFSTYEFGLTLFVKSKDELSVIRNILGENNLKFKMIADNLAKEILQCGICYFKSWKESKDPTKEGMRLLKYAKSIAVGNQTIERIDSNIESMEEFEDKEINDAIELLSSLKSLYVDAISKIDAEVRNMALNMSYNQTINYSKVEKMKAECLNWDKIVEFVKNNISYKDVEIIQKCSKQAKISKYKNLVDFLFEKLGPIQINKIKYICYWKDVRSTQVKSTVKQVTKSVESATSGCYIATMAYGDYDHPQVLELRRFRDDVLDKYYLGKKFIKFYYKYSPQLVEKLKNKEIINSTIRKSLDQLVKIVKKTK